VPVAALSFEGRISSTLRELNPPASMRDFCSIAKIKGIQISLGPLSLALSGKKPLSSDVGRRLLELAQLMKTAQEYCLDIPIAWSQHDRAATLVTLMLLRVVAAEEHYDNLLDSADLALAEFRTQE
jgi:hypothetical protein